MKRMLTPTMMRKCLGQVYIRRNREHQRLNQEDLARISGVSVEQLCAIEDGVVIATWGEIKVLCNNLGLSLWKAIRFTIWSWSIPLWYLRWKISRI